MYWRYGYAVGKFEQRYGVVVERAFRFYLVITEPHCNTDCYRYLLTDGE